MKLIICGAGQVGSAIAANLYLEHDITVIDPDVNKLTQLQNSCDIFVLQGTCSSPEILKEARAFDADAIISVTESDEMNIISCQIADILFNVPLKIARIRSQFYYQEKDKVFSCENMHIDHVISPEVLIKNDILNLIKTPGALHITHFENEKVSLVGVKVDEFAPMVFKTIQDVYANLQKDLIPCEMMVVGMFRAGKPVDFNNETSINANDEIFFFCATQNIKNIMTMFKSPLENIKNIIIIGGGTNGTYIASAIENDYNIKIIEKDPLKAQNLSEKLTNALVLQGDIADQNMLFEEQIDKVDLVLSLTNVDEINMMSAILAKKLGAKKAIVLIQKDSYFNLTKFISIDITISPQQKTISTLTSLIKKNKIINLDFINQTNAMCLEIIAKEENKKNLIGKTIFDLKLPTETKIGLIIRDDFLMMATPTTEICDGDKFVLFSYDKNELSKIVNIFHDN